MCVRIRPLKASYLCIDAQVHFRGIGYFITDVVLEYILPTVIVCADGCLLGYVDQSRSMVGLQTQVIGCTAAATRYIGIDALVHVMLLKNEVYPICIGIDVGINAFSGIAYHVIGIVLRIAGIT